MGEGRKGLIPGRWRLEAHPKEGEKWIINNNLNSRLGKGQITKGKLTPDVAQCLLGVNCPQLRTTVRDLHPHMV